MIGICSYLNHFESESVIFLLLFHARLLPALEVLSNWVRNLISSRLVMPALYQDVGVQGLGLFGDFGLMVILHHVAVLLMGDV